jgi:hypothetical protein
LHCGAYNSREEEEWHKARKGNNTSRLAFSQAYILIKSVIFPQQSATKHPYRETAWNRKKRGEVEGKKWEERK